MKLLALMASLLLLLMAAEMGTMMAQMQKPLSARGERAMNRIESTTGGMDASRGGRGSISDRVGSLVSGIVKKSAAGNRATTKNTELQRKAEAKHREVNKTRRKMSTYAEKKRAAALLRRPSRSLKTGVRRVG
jgi:hypothetical protein